MLVVVFLQQREVFFNFVRKSPSSICLHVCHPDLDLHWSLRDACWRGRVDVCCFSIKLLGSKLAYLKSLVSHCCTCSATLPFTAPEQVLDFAQRLQDKAIKSWCASYSTSGCRKHKERLRDIKTWNNEEYWRIMCPISNPAEFVVVLEWCMPLCQVPLELWLHEGMFHDWVMHPDT